jgi:hypothetical protein
LGNACATALRDIALTPAAAPQIKALRLNLIRKREYISPASKIRSGPANPGEFDSAVTPVIRI